MTTQEFYIFLNKIAPKALSDEFCRKFNGYDNSGIIVDTGKPIKKALFSLDFSLAAVDKAVAAGADVIVTHHPAIYAKMNRLRFDAADKTEQKIVRAIANGISVISMHLNLDTASGGIDDSLKQGMIAAAKGEFSGVDYEKEATMSLMNANSAIDMPETDTTGTTDAAEKENEKYMIDLQTNEGYGGYGRVYDVQPVTFEELTKNVAKEFCVKHADYYGDGGRIVRRIANFCGGGADEQAIAFAVAQGADVMVSSDFKHHIITGALESGLAVIRLTHYASEIYGFEKFYQKIRRQTGLACIFHVDAELL